MLIALAYDNVVDAVDRAVEHAEKAKAILLARIAHLESSANPTETDAREIADIKSLMGDVDMKVRMFRSLCTGSQLISNPRNA